jgi:predicted nucleotidyltransferase
LPFPRPSGRITRIPIIWLLEGERVRKDLEEILAELDHRLGSLYGERPVQLILFGSQARGDAEEGSDIDFLVVLDGPIDPGREIARTSEMTASLSLDTVISCTFISADRYAVEKSPLVLNVRREGVPV